MQLNFNVPVTMKAYAHHHYLIETDLVSHAVTVVQFRAFKAQPGDWLFELDCCPNCGRKKKHVSNKPHKIEKKLAVVKEVKETEAEVI